MNKLRIIDRTGDTVMTWDVLTEANEAVKLAEAEFDRKKRAGYAAFTQEPDGSGEHITAFKPDASTIIMMAPITGG
jgi:hypothetical protein